MTWISPDRRSEDPIIRMSAMLAIEFGWTVDYVVFKLPLSYLNAYAELIVEKHEAENAAVNGKGHTPASEMTPERIDQKKRLLAKHYSKIDEEMSTEGVKWPAGVLK
jgi:hypothetical protein